jgi:hypothetical protein
VNILHDLHLPLFGLNETYLKLEILE